MNMPDLANRPFEDPCLPVGFQDTFFVNGHSYQLIGTGPHIADIVLQKIRFLSSKLLLIAIIA